MVSTKIFYRDLELHMKMALSVINGGLAGRDVELKRLNEDYSSVKKDLERFVDEHYKGYATLLKHTIETYGDGRGLIKNQGLFKRFFNEFSSSIEAPAAIRPTYEVVMECVNWDIDDLGSYERDMVFHWFANDMTQFYFAANTIKPEGIKNCRPLMEKIESGFNEVVFRGIKSMYSNDLNWFLEDHSFFYGLFSYEENGKKSFFRNAWILWYNSMMDYSVREVNVINAIHIDHLVSYLFKIRDIDGMKKQLKNLRKIINLPYDEEKDILLQKIFEKVSDEQRILQRRSDDQAKKQLLMTAKPQKI